MRSLSSLAHQADPVTIRARQMAKRYMRKDDPHGILQGVILFTLANWQELQPLYEAQLNYCFAEDLHPHNYWLKKMCSKRRRK
jgi:hypothetical protein